MGWPIFLKKTSYFLVSFINSTHYSQNGEVNLPIYSYVEQSETKEKVAKNTLFKKSSSKIGSCINAVGTIL